MCVISVYVGGGIRCVISVCVGVRCVWIQVDEPFCFLFLLFIKVREFSPRLKVVPAKHKTDIQRVLVTNQTIVEDARLILYMAKLQTYWLM